MHFLKTKSLNKKIAILTVLILIFGLGIQLITNNENQSAVKGVMTEENEHIKLINLADYNDNLLNMEFISLQEYESIIEEQLLQELHIDTDPNFDKKVENIENYLKGRQSPFTDKAWYIVALGNKYDVDYRLVTAISVIESNAGKETYRPYNAWGWGGAEGIEFKSWKHSIYTVTKGIAVGYHQRGAVTPQQIAPSYNPHTPDQWGAKVQLTMNQIGPNL